MTKRKADDTNDEEEQKAEKEIEIAIESAKAVPSDDKIIGLGNSKGVIHIQYRPKKAQSQYTNTTYQDNEKPFILTYFALQALGEVPKLMLAEAGVQYDEIVMVSGEDQDKAMEWRSRSPNGLLPMLSGGGIPRSTPISQSGAVIKFLANRFGMDGGKEGTCYEQTMVHVLYETAKDLGNHKSIISSLNPKKDDNDAKGPFALASHIEDMLKKMSDPSDDKAILNYGQIQLYQCLKNCEARRNGCILENLGTKLDQFRLAIESRNTGISSYIKSNICFPFTNGELGLDGGYVYKSGPIRRGDICC